MEDSYVRSALAGALLCLLAGTSLLAQESSPYIYKVYEYLPAPGQFINIYPAYEEGNTQQDINAKVENMIANNKKQLISLGAWGGYVVFGFDHAVENQHDRMDIQILGNAFLSDKTHPEDGGSSEPAVVWVSYDANGNGEPDDAWYEIAGSEYHSADTRHNYSVTYYRTPQDHVATPDNEHKYHTDTTLIRWKDSEGRSGYIMQNAYHQQDYFPQWIEKDSITFIGTRLADNGQPVGNNYVQYPYAYGYADNYPNDNLHSKINIDWAVDAAGMRVHLPSANFVRVATAVQQNCGMIGECSTEVTGAVDLHLTGEDEYDTLSSTEDDLHDLQSAEGINLLTTCVNEYIIITSFSVEPVQVRNFRGQLMFSANTQSGTTILPCPWLNKGLYMIQIGDTTFKFIKQ